VKAGIIRNSGCAALVILAAAATWFLRTEETMSVPAQVSATVTRSHSEFLVAPARIEPASDEIKVTCGLPGTLASVPLEEGDQVHRGQVIAELSNADYLARVQLAEAQVQLRQAELARVVNGFREEERREARALVNEAEAVLAFAQSERQRYQGLYRSGDVSKSKADAADREFAVAKARYDALRERHALTIAPARADERTRAEAAVLLAQKQVAEAQAIWNRTRVRSPLDGIVIKKHLHAGETISELAPGPVYTLADDSRLRARVEIDERDVARVQLGQNASFTADAYGRTAFQGHVVRVGRMLGKKSIRGDEPTERVDQKILEALVDLEPGVKLPIGLRGTCRIQVN
jgi:HlyD family secretion protein